jgi:hypothetical protein
MPTKSGWLGTTLTATGGGADADSIGAQRAAVATSARGAATKRSGASPNKRCRWFDIVDLRKIVNE